VADILDKLPVPDPVRAGLRQLTDDMKAAAGSRLAGLILYGGLARGRYYPGRSDINLLVLLKDAGIDTLTAIGPVLHAAWRAWRVEPFLLTPAEIEPAAAAFPTKFLDIQMRHVMLLGDDPFTAMHVPRDHVRLRIGQELCNFSLRLRRRFLGIADDPAELTQALTEIARPLAVELSSLLTFAGNEVPEEAGTAEILHAAATAFKLDDEALAQIAALRQQALTPVDARALFGRVLATLASAAAVVARWKEPPP
jgi:hypothetical protein